MGALNVGSSESLIEGDYFEFENKNKSLFSENDSIIHEDTIINVISRHFRVNSKPVNTKIVRVQNGHTPTILTISLRLKQTAITKSLQNVK